MNRINRCPICNGRIINTTCSRCHSNLELLVQIEELYVYYCQLVVHKLKQQEYLPALNYAQKAQTLIANPFTKALVQFTQQKVYCNEG